MSIPITHRSALRQLVSLLALTVVLALAACGDDAGSGSDDPDDGGNEGTDDPCLSLDDDSAEAVRGRVYEDKDDTDVSAWANAFNAEIDAPLAALQVSLIGSSGEASGVTCADGTFAFAEPGPGLFLVDLGLDAAARVATQNRPLRLPVAIREGQIDLVTFGDSLPVVSDDTPVYAERVSSQLAELATVNYVNVAVPGSTAAQWQPGDDYFDERLRPHLADADLILISLGGNDALGFMAGAITNQDNVDEILSQSDELAAEIRDRVLVIIAEIRAINPNADIVYGLYPNYAVSDEWYFMLGGLADDVAVVLSEALETVRRQLIDERLILVDLYELMTADVLDTYLLDQLHFNDAGHQVYAEGVLSALGAGRLDAEAFGQEHVWSVTTP